MKIGRAIARTKVSDNNAIFDCKVLSRNHAELWYEDGKFYLKVSPVDRRLNSDLIENYLRTPAAATVLLLTISVLVKHVKLLSHSRSAAVTSFSSVSMLWRIHAKRRTGASWQRFVSSCPMGAKLKPVNRHSSVLRTQKYRKSICIDSTSTSKRQFNANRISKASC